MKKQLGLIIAMLAVAQMSFAAFKAIDRMSMDEFMRKEGISASKIDAATDSKALADNAKIIARFASTVGSNDAQVAKNIKRQPKVAESYAFTDMVLNGQSVYSATPEMQRLAVAAKDLLGNYGIAKNLTKEGQADAQAESLAVQKFIELIPVITTKNYGEKAIRVAEVMADGVTKQGLSMNKALRKAATEVLGLKGQELEDFMKDQEKGLGGCKE